MWLLDPDQKLGADAWLEVMKAKPSYTRFHPVNSAFETKHGISYATIVQGLLTDNPLIHSNIDAVFKNYPQFAEGFVTEAFEIGALAAQQPGSEPHLVPETRMAIQNAQKIGKVTLLTEKLHLAGQEIPEDIRSLARSGYIHEAEEALDRHLNSQDGPSGKGDHCSLIMKKIALKSLANP